MDESVLRAVWRLVTAPVRMLLLALLWVFAADGGPLRVLGLILTVFVLAQLVTYLTGGQVLIGRQH
jgi:hypothetical protein